MRITPSEHAFEGVVSQPMTDCSIRKIEGQLNAGARTQAPPPPQEVQKGFLSMDNCSSLLPFVPMGILLVQPVCILLMWAVLRICGVSRTKAAAWALSQASNNRRAGTDSSVVTTVTTSVPCAVHR
jgi:hypothetical protein